MLDLCQRDGIPVKEVDVPIADLKRADEAFLTSSLREVQPIELIDGSPANANTCPGPISSRLAEAFSRLVAQQIDP